MNPDQVIATSERRCRQQALYGTDHHQGHAAISAQIRVRTDDMPIGVIAVDAIYTPVERVNLTS